MPISMHKIVKHDDGIEVIVAYPFTFQARLDFACNNAHMEFVDATINGARLGLNDLVKIAMSSFYFCKGYYCSITSDFHTQIQAKVTTYCQDLINSLKTKDAPEAPTIDEPEEVLEEDTYFFKYSEFVFEKGPSQRQKIHLTKLNNDACLANLLTKIEGLDLSVPHHISELNLTQSARTACRKKHYLEPAPGKGNYYIRLPKEG